MCFFHKWSKWEEYERKMTVVPGGLMPKENRAPFDTIEKWQKRTCSKCGYTQRKEVNEF